MGKILFVYNAESGVANALLDTGRRIFRPKEYPCTLCVVTYGPFGMKNDWKKFTNSLPFETSFIHKDELPKIYTAMQLTFPCVLLDDSKTTTVLISASEFSKINDLNTLKNTVTAKLKPYTRRHA